MKLVQSIERAVNILDFVADSGQGVRLKEIAEKLVLKQSTAHNLLNTLCALNLVQQAKNRYRLGPRTLYLGNRYLESLSLYDVAKPIVKELVHQFNENFYLVMMEDSNFYFLIRVESTHNVKPTRTAIDKSTSHATAIGKVLLSSFEPESLKRFIRENGLLQGFTVNTITTEEKLAEELKRVRAAGYALDREEMEIGINCISVPIRNHRGETVAALGAEIPTQRFSPRTVDTMLPVLREAAGRISAELGHRP